MKKQKLEAKIRLLEEELGCLHGYLDLLAIPRTCFQWGEYTLMGRVQQLGKDYSELHLSQLEVNRDSIKLAMQEYAKSKCKELLEIVVEKVNCKDVQTQEILDNHDLACDYRIEVNKNSILKAVNLDEFIV